MTARRRVRRARVVLTASVALAALLWALAAGGLVLVVAALLDWALGLGRSMREPVGALAAIAAVAAASVVAWRGRGVGSDARVALWLEEQLPSLRYALVTAIDSTARAGPELERMVGGVEWGRPLRHGAARAVAPPAIGVATMLLVLFVLPRGIVARVSAPAPGDALDRPTASGENTAERLSPLIVRVSPPSYARERGRVLEEPHTVSALVGSAITIQGPGTGGVEATHGERALERRDAAGRWSVSLTMPARPGVIRFRAGAGERLLILEPRADSAPHVTLTRPARDTVLRAPSGAVALAAQASDAIGLVSGWFEVIVSSGEGETFTFRSAVLARTTLGGTRQAELVARLSLDSLKVAPGDIVHVRAVARDGNTSSGPGQGASETRTLRIARAGEYDSVAVEGALPLEAEKSELSQRMLIMMTEALERRRPRLARETVIAESRTIGVEQARLRRRVSEIIFIRLEEGEGGEHSHAPGDGHDHGRSREEMTPEALLRAAEEATAAASEGEVLDFAGGESPVVAINRPLLEAYNAMWDAGRELDIGEPGRALPHMRLALEAIQRARAAERYYLRGRVRVPVVDLGRVRLAGDRSDAAPRTRASRAPTGDPLATLGARLDGAIALLREPRAQAVDSLLLLRVDALERAPALAAALADAIDDLRAGRDATDALARARRATLGASTSASGVPRWGGAW